MAAHNLAHPCFNPGAAHSVGRIHLPVARRCNIKCAYCNPREDCVHESGPGAASRVLSPAAAQEHLETALTLDPRIKVIGIAGPGEPLANEETFETLSLAGKNPRTRPLFRCLSTNGLALPANVERLVEFGVEALTVTVNAVDPEIGARIYLSVRAGEGGAALLLERQLSGIEQAVKAGITVKVNSVVIPGINDRHVPEIARRCAELGVTLFNVMPLVPRAAFREVPPPSRSEIHRIRDEVKAIIPVMRHCRQCRADASGLIGEGGHRESGHRKSAEIAAQKRTEVPPVRVAVATSGSGLVDRHFGHVPHFDIYEVRDQDAVMVERREIEKYCTGVEECEPEDRLRPLIELLTDCPLVLCTKIGPEPARRLLRAGVEVRQIFGPIERAAALAVAAYRDNGGLMRRAELQQNIIAPTAPSA